jgi:hypothetical protein
MTPNKLCFAIFGDSSDLETRSAGAQANSNSCFPLFLNRLTLSACVYAELLMDTPVLNDSVELQTDTLGLDRPPEWPMDPLGLNGLPK